MSVENTLVIYTENSLVLPEVPNSRDTVLAVVYLNQDLVRIDDWNKRRCM